MAAIVDDVSAYNPNCLRLMLDSLLDSLVPNACVSSTDAEVWCTAVKKLTDVMLSNEAGVEVDASLYCRTLSAVTSAMALRPGVERLQEVSCAVVTTCANTAKSASVEFPRELFHCADIVNETAKVWRSNKSILLGLATVLSWMSGASEFLSVSERYFEGLLRCMLECVEPPFDVLNWYAEHAPDLAVTAMNVVVQGMISVWDGKEYQTNACLFISTLSTNPQLRSAILDSGAVDRLIHTMALFPTEASILGHACLALENLVRGISDPYSPTLLRLVSEDGLLRVCAAMRNHLDSVTIQESCVKLFMHLAHTASGDECVLASDAVARVCEAMATHSECDSVTDAGCAVLHNLSCRVVDNHALVDAVDFWASKISTPVTESPANMTACRALNELLIGSTVVERFIACKVLPSFFSVLSSPGRLSQVHTYCWSIVYNISQHPCGQDAILSCQEVFEAALPFFSDLKGLTSLPIITYVRGAVAALCSASSSQAYTGFMSAIAACFKSDRRRMACVAIVGVADAFPDIASRFSVFQDDVLAVMAECPQDVSVQIAGCTFIHRILPSTAFQPPAGVEVKKEPALAKLVKRVKCAMALCDNVLSQGESGEDVVGRDVIVGAAKLDGMMVTKHDAANGVSSVNVPSNTEVEGNTEAVQTAHDNITVATRDPESGLRLLRAVCSCLLTLVSQRPAAVLKTFRVSLTFDAIAPYVRALMRGASSVEDVMVGIRLVQYWSVDNQVIVCPRYDWFGLLLEHLPKPLHVLSSIIGQEGEKGEGSVGGGENGEEGRGGEKEVEASENLITAVWETIGFLCVRDDNRGKFSPEALSPLLSSLSSSPASFPLQSGCWRLVLELIGVKGREPMSIPPPSLLELVRLLLVCVKSFKDPALEAHVHNQIVCLRVLECLGEECSGMRVYDSAAGCVSASDACDSCNACDADGYEASTSRAVCVHECGSVGLGTANERSTGSIHVLHTVLTPGTSPLLHTLARFSSTRRVVEMGLAALNSWCARVHSFNVSLRACCRLLPSLTLWAEKELHALRSKYAVNSGTVRLHTVGILRSLWLAKPELLTPLIDAASAALANGV